MRTESEIKGMVMDMRFALTELHSCLATGMSMQAGVHEDGSAWVCVFDREGNQYSLDLDRKKGITRYHAIREGVA